MEKIFFFALLLDLALGPLLLLALATGHGGLHLLLLGFLLDLAKKDKFIENKTENRRNYDEFVQL